ncbi:MAG: hypothetical protein ACK46A_08560 [Akkermansiaceae bacterium]|jgi:hypothetical protein
MNHCYQLICISQEKDLLELDDAAHLSGMHREMIEVFLRAGIVKSKPDLNGLLRIDLDGVERLRQIQRMRQKSRPILRNIRLVFSLTDQLAKAERELHDLRSQLSFH